MNVFADRNNKWSVWEKISENIIRCVCARVSYSLETRSLGATRVLIRFVSGQTQRRSERRVFLPGEAEEHAACGGKENNRALGRGVPRPPHRAAYLGDGQDAQGRRLPREDHAPD